MGKTKGIKQREYDEEFKMDSEKNYFESGKSVKNVLPHYSFYFNVRNTGTLSVIAL